MRSFERGDLLAMDEQIIEKVIAYITELFRSDAGGHDVEHTLRVYRNALLIAEEEAAWRSADMRFWKTF